LSHRVASRTWLFDLDDTLHDASFSAFAATSEAMTTYIAEHLGLSLEEATALRQHYWHRYGATLLGLVRHHGVKASHFLEETHRLPGLEERLRTSAHDRAALRSLRGRKFVLTHAPRTYALRVLKALRLDGAFDGILCIEDMTMFGQPRPKPDARMLRHIAARLKTRPDCCVLVEDTLAHQRSARRIGMKTVWMQRYLREAVHAGAWEAKVGVHPCPKPAYVCARIKRIQPLRALWCTRDDRPH
jgi:putative hydrolase of the HAD superfamily